MSGLRRRTQRARDEGGSTLVEVLLAIPILAIGILAVLGTLTVGFVQVAQSGGESKATSYARQQLEQLKNQAFNAGPVGPTTDTPEPGITRTWRITPVAGFAAPNALARITVAVQWKAGAGAAQGITLETMRSQ